MVEVKGKVFVFIFCIIVCIGLGYCWVCSVIFEVNLLFSSSCLFCVCVVGIVVNSVSLGFCDDMCYFF